MKENVHGQFAQESDARAEGKLAELERISGDAVDKLDQRTAPVNRLDAELAAPRRLGCACRKEGGRSPAHLDPRAGASRRADAAGHWNESEAAKNRALRAAELRSQLWTAVDQSMIKLGNESAWVQS